MNGVDEISVPANAVIKFSYPAIDDPLYIHSGATSIKWSYHLNTQATPTLGGEVVQILSAMVGPITITGQTSGLKTNKTGKLDASQTPGWRNENGKSAYGPNHELQDIVAWFRKYMTIAGTDNTGNAFRSERAIYFEYPERGWNFMIMPTGLSGFRYDKGVIAPEWSITAEIVSNNALDYFAGVTMSSFTDDLLTTNAQLQGQIGLSQFALSGAQVSNTNFGQTGDYGSTNPFLNPELGPSALAALHKMGDNFQGLVAAWSQGDFAHFGFGAMLDNNALPQNVDAVYQKLFGSTFLGSLPGWNGGVGGGSGTGSYSYTGSNQQDAVAVQVANAFSAKGLPPELGIAVALHEATLDPDAVQGVPYAGVVEGDGAVGLFQTFYHSLQNGGPGRGAGTAHANEVRAAQAPLSLGKAPPKGYKVTDYYAAADQCDDAANWFSPYKTSATTDDDFARWAFRAQGGIGYTSDNTTTGTCTSLFASDLAKARQILKQLTASGGNAPNGYKNPLRDVKNLTPLRIDQGVDYSGHGPIYALGNGVIIQAHAVDPGWPGSNPGVNSGGGAITYKLTDGPAQGLYVYVCENINVNPGLFVGMNVTSDTVLCTLNEGGANLETGWAIPGTDAAPMAKGVGANAGSSAPSSIFGVNFSNLLNALGAPAGIKYGTPPDSLPSGWPKF